MLTVYASYLFTSRSPFYLFTVSFMLSIGTFRLQNIAVTIISLIQITHVTKTTHHQYTQYHSFKYRPSKSSSDFDISLHGNSASVYTLNQ